MLACNMGKLIDTPRGLVVADSLID